MRPRDYYVCGVKVHAVDTAETIAAIDGFIESKARAYVVLTNAMGVVLMQEDPELLRINNDADLVTADGMPLVWIGQRRGLPVEKVTSSLMPDLFDHGRAKGYRHFLYGGAEGTPALLEERLCQRFPGAIVAGGHSPPFRKLSDREVEEDAARINEARPDIVWVGLGCPKQEKWMARYRPLLDAPVLIGVGAAFDFFSGQKPVAPRWLQNSPFEWAFRLVTEPRRMARRYGEVIPKFIYYVASERLRR